MGEIDFPFVQMARDTIFLWLFRLANMHWVSKKQPFFLSSRKKTRIYVRTNEVYQLCASFVVRTLPRREKGAHHPLPALTPARKGEGLISQGGGGIGKYKEKRAPKKSCVTFSTSFFHGKKGLVLYHKKSLVSYYSHSGTRRRKRGEI